MPIINPNSGTFLRILVTGAGGQVGKELVSSIANRGHLPIAVGHTPGDGLDAIVDLSDSESVNDIVRFFQPRLIIHAAAMTDVDGCEINPELADSVNRVGSENIAQAALKVGARVLGVSTDFVFSGDDAPYAEDAAASPISVYGASKQAGEQAILTAHQNNVIVRTSWVYGGPGKHFPRTILNLLARNETISVVQDERGSPTLASDLAEALASLATVQPSGIFHLSNSGSVSRYELAKEVALLAGIDDARILPTTAVDFARHHPLPARRPGDTTLLNRRAAALGIEMRPWQAALASYIPRLVEQFNPTGSN